MIWGEVQLWWLPTASVAALAVLGFLALARQPPRKYWLTAMLLISALAIGASAWQQHANQVALAGETARLTELWPRLDEVGRLLPGGPGTTPAQTFDTVAAALGALNARIKELEAQMRALEERSRTRTIDPDRAAKIAEYLRQF